MITKEDKRLEGYYTPLLIYLIYVCMYVYVYFYLRVVTSLYKRNTEIIISIINLGKLISYLVGLEFGED